MQKNKSYFQLFILIILFIRCAAPSGVPSNYLVNPKEISNMTTGNWINIEQIVNPTSVAPIQISGELITVQADTFYILTQTSLLKIPKTKITSATLYLFKNQSGKYVVATGIGLLPNIIGAISLGEPGFLALGIPFALVGTITAIIENPSSELRFPKKAKLDEFGKFSRFPEGIPSGVELDSLTLLTIPK
jgi:hypothetical protein